MRVIQSLLAAYFLLFISSIAFAQAPAEGSAVTMRVDHNGLSKLGWQLLWPTATFKEMPVTQTIEMLHAQTAHHLELSPGLVLSADHPEVKIGPDMPADSLAAMMSKMQQDKMDFVSYGVVTLNVPEADARKIFDFAKKLKVKYIVAEAGANSVEMIDALCNEYGINVAIMAWSIMVDPDAMLAALAGRSNHLGVCADVAEWRAAGKDPVECAKKLTGHIFEVRVRDIDAQHKDVLLGAGTVDLAAVMKQLKDQGFKGGCCITYAAGKGPEVLSSYGKSVSAFSDIVTKLAQ